MLIQWILWPGAPSKCKQVYIYLNLVFSVQDVCVSINWSLINLSYFHLELFLTLSDIYSFQLESHLITLPFFPLTISWVVQFDF